MSLRLAVIVGVLLTGLTLFSHVSAQSRFDTWTIDNGLPQNTVNSILQTRDGYLWLTTFNGLVRFDGVRFTVYDKSNSPGIESNRFTTLFEDPEGNLWIGTESNGFTKYAHGIFTMYPESAASWYNTFPPLSGDSGPGLWVSNQERLNRLRSEISTNSSVGDHSTSGNESEIPSLEAIQKRSGEIRVDKAELVIYLDGQPLTYTVKDGLPAYGIRFLFRDNRGNGWFGAEDAGILKFREGKFTAYRKKDGLPSDRITAACEDRHGAFWFWVDQAGLYRLKNGQLTLYTSADGFNAHDIHCIYEDREGSIWIGTTDAGLSRVRENIVSVYSTRDGLSGDNIYPILEDRAGSVWIGAWPGLNQHQNGKLIRRSDLGLLRDGGISSFYEDKEGGFWIGTYGGGVYRLKGQELSKFNGLAGVKANGWLAITQDRAGAFWFGTTHGLFKYDQGTLTWLTLDDGLPNNRINAIFEGRDGSLWLGTLGGLACLKDKSLTVYTEKDGLSANHVRSFYEDLDGTLWIGTYDGGLNRFKEGRFTSYTMREGMFDNGVFRILDDGRGNFWMSSNRGIYRARRQELEDYAAGKIRSITTVGYGKGDGMLNAECNGGVQPAGARTRDGRLWFPTQQGVAVIDPATIHANALPPPVLIEEFALEDQKIAFAGGVRVLPGQERFEIRYTALSFIKPEQVRFKYKLEGLDDDWIDAGARRTVNYSYVPPGQYTFRVMAANSDGIWNTEGASLPIVVKPPFWRTWWFISLAGLLMIGTAVWWHQRRLSRVKRAQEAQQEFSRQLIVSQENDRKRIAAELHDSLGQSLVIIKNRAILSLTTPENQQRTKEQGSIAKSGSYVSSNARSDPSSAFPRLRMLWTYSKKPR